MSRELVRIGFVPLLDCAPLVVAAECGFAAHEGLELRLQRESSWANIRDRLIVGHFDAAHMLGPMVIASTLGIGHLRVPMIAPLALGTGGNAITVSRTLWMQMCQHGAYTGAGPREQGRALEAVVRARARRGHPPLGFGMVYPFSTHNYLLRYWLAACGIDPERDVRLYVIPPPLMSDALRERQIDGFCVGEPWNSLAVESEAGCIITTARAIWQAAPDKVLALRAERAHEQPEQLAALVRAVHRAAAWCEQPANNAELSRLLAEPRHVGAPRAVLERVLGGTLRLAPDSAAVAMPAFWSAARNRASVPWPEHALWFLSQMARWGQTACTGAAIDAARACYRPELALVLCGSGDEGASPASAARDASMRASALCTGFFDARELNPDRLNDYIASFAALAAEG